MRAKSSERRSDCTRHGGASNTRNVEASGFSGSKAAARSVDISADFRLRDVAVWERWYKAKHAAPELLREAVYGLCELNRERIRGARLIANPGCYPTAIQLGFLPLVEAGVVDLDHLIADAKSGVSGAGRKAELSLAFSEASDNFSAYNVPGHR